MWPALTQALATFVVWIMPPEPPESSPPAFPIDMDDPYGIAEWSQIGVRRH